MRRMVTVLGVAVALIGALAAPVGADNEARPFKGAVEGEYVIGPVGFDECPVSDVFFGGFRSDFAATGIVSHMGNTAVTAQHCTATAQIVSGGTMTLIAANGDEVFIEYSGITNTPVIPGVTEELVVDLDFDIVGGTGRFLNAGGGGEMTWEVTVPGFPFAVWPTDIAWTGTIDY